MEALDILEKRIDSLNRILGPLPDAAPADTPAGSAPGESETVVESLISAHSLINSATKDSEPIKNALGRAPELEKYLDPDFLDENQKVHAKEVYLNTIAPHLLEKFEQLGHIKKMEPTLGAEYFRNIPGECTDKLKQIATDNAQFQQQSELIEESLILAMKRYGEIQVDLMKSLNTMQQRLEVVEDKLQKKKKDDLLKDVPFEEASEGHK